MDRRTFRDAALARLSTPDRLDQPVRITSAWGWAALTSLLILISTACVASCVIVAPETVHGDGVIMSPIGILEVPFPSSGRLAEISVRTGDHVKKGSVVARIEQPALRRALEEADKEHSDLVEERRSVASFQSQVAQAQDALDQQRRLGLQHSLELVRRRLGFLAERAAIDAELGNQHLITRTQIVDTKVAIGGAEEEFDTTQRRINEIALDATNAKIRNQRELLGLDLKIEAAARATSLAAARLQQAEEVMSPYDGEVVEIQHDVGELVQEGAALMTVLPAEPVPTSKGDASPAPLLVMLFVPDTDGKKITAGMTAEITPSTVRREEYGFIVGRVKQVAAIPSTPEGMTHVLKNQRLAEALSAGGAPFAVELELIPNAATPSGYTWSSGPGPNIAISPGTLAHGDIWIRRLRLIEFAVPALHGLLGSRI